jgi:hypothetical protein
VRKVRQEGLILPSAYVIATLSSATSFLLFLPFVLRDSRRHSGNGVIITLICVQAALPCLFIALVVMLEYKISISLQLFRFYP